MKIIYMKKVMRSIGYGIITVVLAGCYAEGNSHFLASGEAEYFLTMERCAEEAKTKHSDDSPKYSGYECRGKVLWFTTGRRDFYEGKLSSQSGQ